MKPGRGNPASSWIRGLIIKELKKRRRGIGNRKNRIDNRTSKKNMVCDK